MPRTTYIDGSLWAAQTLTNNAVTATTGNTGFSALSGTGVVIRALRSDNPLIPSTGRVVHFPSGGNFRITPTSGSTSPFYDSEKHWQSFWAMFDVSDTLADNANSTAIMDFGWGVSTVRFNGRVRRQTGNRGLFWWLSHLNGNAPSSILTLYPNTPVIPHLKPVRITLGADRSAGTIELYLNDALVSYAEGIDTSGHSGTSTWGGYNMISTVPAFIFPGIECWSGDDFQLYKPNQHRMSRRDRCRMASYLRAGATRGGGLSWTNGTINTEPNPGSGIFRWERTLTTTDAGTLETLNTVADEPRGVFGDESTSWHQTVYIPTGSYTQTVKDLAGDTLFTVEFADGEVAVNGTQLVTDDSVSMTYATDKRYSLVVSIHRDKPVGVTIVDHTTNIASTDTRAAWSAGVPGLKLDPAQIGKISGDYSASTIRLGPITFGAITCIGVDSYATTNSQSVTPVTQSPNNAADQALNRAENDLAVTDGNWKWADQASGIKLDPSVPLGRTGMRFDHAWLRCIRYLTHLHGCVLMIPSASVNDAGAGVSAATNAQYKQALLDLVIATDNVLWLGTCLTLPAHGDSTRALGDAYAEADRLLWERNKHLRNMWYTPMRSDRDALARQFGTGTDGVHGKDYLTFALDVQYGGNAFRDDTALVEAVRAAMERGGGNLDTLLDRVSEERAENLDDISSAANNASAVRAELATELARIDASITSRMASFSLPSNFSSLLIDGNGRMTVGSIANNAITANAINDGALTILKFASGVFPSGFSTLTITTGRIATDVGTLIDDTTSGLNANIVGWRSAMPGNLDGNGFVPANVAAVNGNTTRVTTFADSLDAGQLSNVGSAMTLTEGERMAVAVEVESHLLDEGDSQPMINAIVTAIGNVNMDEVALIAAIRADLERNGGNLNTLLTRLTADRAGYLDGLNVASLATRLGTLPTTGTVYTGGNITGNLSGSVGSISGVTFPAGFHNLTVANIQSGMSTLNADGVRSAVGMAAANLDTQLSGLLTTAGYTAPDNAGIAAIKAKTDTLPAEPASKDDVSPTINFNPTIEVDGGFTSGDRDKLEATAATVAANLDAKVSEIGGGGGGGADEQEIIDGVVAGLTGKPVSYAGPIDQESEQAILYAGMAYSVDQLKWIKTDYQGGVASGDPISCRFLKLSTYQRSGSSAEAELELSGEALLADGVLVLAFAASAEQTAGLDTQWPVDARPTHRVQVWSGATLLVDTDAEVRRSIEELTP